MNYKLINRNEAVVLAGGSGGNRAQGCKGICHGGQLEDIAYLDSNPVCSHAGRRRDKLVNYSFITKQIRCLVREGEWDSLFFENIWHFYKEITKGGRIELTTPKNSRSNNLASFVRLSDECREIEK
ncbi:hypothetical protein AVEN_135465-1 [Araneus ventricosus]|uniref:Uncharacterized protein n=1 Tax=Araneus ventricosus TaxID=182803 RepID=A0A4Y2BCS5_ARAVE|nr:hypothetical protein AVEN_135465-1 [Araneus ventricosus]